MSGICDHNMAPKAFPPRGLLIRRLLLVSLPLKAQHSPKALHNMVFGPKNPKI